MDNAIVAAPDLILRYLETGESDVVEFKERLSDPSILARYLSAFANTDGGTVLVGIREPNVVIGCDPVAVERVYHRAVQQVHPRPETSFHVVQSDGKDVATISVRRSPEVVSAREGVFTRIGSTTRPSTAQEITERLSPAPTERDRKGIAEALALLTQTIAEQNSRLEEYAEEIRSQKALLKEQAEKTESMAQTVHRVDQRSADGERLTSKLKNDFRSNGVGIPVAVVGGALISHIPWHSLFGLVSRLVTGSH